MDLPPAGHRYGLVSRATGFAISGNEAEADEPAKSVFAVGHDPEFRFGSAELWTLLQRDIGHVLKHGSGLVLDSNLERQVSINEENNGSFQKWLLEDGDDEGFWTIKNLATSFVLDGNPDGDIFTMRRNDGAFQRWHFELQDD